MQDNWRAEAARFFPSLPVTAWNRTGGSGLDGDFRLIVINYNQLRLHEDVLREVKWGAIILDEAQAIKNPSSQSARAACALAASHRLALAVEHDDVPGSEVVTVVTLRWVARGRAWSVKRQIQQGVPRQRPARQSAGSADHRTG